MTGEEMRARELLRESMKEHGVITQNGKCVEPSALLDTVDTFTKMMEEDMVNHPKHYKAYPLENLEVIKGSMNFDEYAGFLKGNALKYLYRYRTKGKPVEDLEKAIFYINELKGQVKE